MLLLMLRRINRGDPGSLGGNYQENHVGDEAPLRGDISCSKKL